jgi:hypothetical protein
MRVARESDKCQSDEFLSIFNDENWMAIIIWRQAVLQCPEPWLDLLFQQWREIWPPVL